MHVSLPRHRGQQQQQQQQHRVADPNNPAALRAVVTLFKMQLLPLIFITDLVKISNSVMSNAAVTQETADYGEDVSVGKVGGVFKKILKEGTGSKGPQDNSEVIREFQSEFKNYFGRAMNISIDAGFCC
jgi:hypothetical protein